MFKIVVAVLSLNILGVVVLGASKPVPKQTPQPATVTPVANPVTKITGQSVIATILKGLSADEPPVFKLRVAIEGGSDQPFHIVKLFGTADLAFADEMSVPLVTGEFDSKTADFLPALVVGSKNYKLHISIDQGIKGNPDATAIHVVFIPQVGTNPLEVKIKSKKIGIFYYQFSSFDFVTTGLLDTKGKITATGTCKSFQSVLDTTTHLNKSVPLVCTLKGTFDRTTGRFTYGVDFGVEK